MGTYKLSDEHKLAESLLVEVFAGVSLTGVGAGMLVWHVAELTSAVASTHDSSATGTVPAAAGGVGPAAVAVLSSQVLVAAKFSGELLTGILLAGGAGAAAVVPSSKVLVASAVGNLSEGLLTGSMALSRDPSWA